MTAGGFLERWLGSAGAERSHAQPFFTDLCDLLDVPRPPSQGRPEAARPEALDAAEVADAFTNPPPSAIRRHLDMLERIGVLVAYDDNSTTRHWHSASA